MKYFGLALLFFVSVTICSGQIVTDQKEAERLYKKSILEAKNNKAYFSEAEKCRKLINEQSYVQAESSCKLSVMLVERLPKSSYMERHSAYKMLGLAFIRQRKAQEAITSLEKSLQAGKSNLDDTNSETGEVYFLLGQANQLLENTELASDYYTKAENTFRFAFVEIDDDVRFDYVSILGNILETHIILAENANLKEKSEKYKKRLSDFKIEFAKYLKE